MFRGSRPRTTSLDVDDADRDGVVVVARAPREAVAAANDDVDVDRDHRGRRRTPGRRTASSSSSSSSSSRTTARRHDRLPDGPRHSGRSAFLRPIVDDVDEDDDDEREDEGASSSSRLRVRVRVDGSVAVANDDDDDRVLLLLLPGGDDYDDDVPRAALATCDRRRPGPTTSTASRCCFADDRQADAIARLSAMRVVTGGRIVVRSSSSATTTTTPPPIVAGGGGGTGTTAGVWNNNWLLGLPFALARTMGRGVGRAIDGVLSAYDGDEYGDFYPGTSTTATTTTTTMTGGGGRRRIASDATGTERGWEESNDDMSSHSVRRMLAMDVACTPKIDLDDRVYGDDDVERRASATDVEVDTSGEEEAFDLEAVASACRGLLAYARLLLDARDGTTTTTTGVVFGEGNDDDCREFFAPRRDGCRGGGGGRVMMLLLGDASGGDACTFGGLCRGAGRRRAAITTTTTTTTTTTDGHDRGGPTENDDDDDPARRRCDDIVPPDLAEVDVDLLARTLVASGLARMEGDVITIYPGGIPDSERLGSRRSSDEALFRIHVTRIAIRDRMARLERDAYIAGKDAVKARKIGSTHSALVLMRKRKLALAESERCASVLVNLDASELALERAEDDVRIAQSYSLVRDAFRSIRESNGIDDDGGVNELIMDIREEMDGMDGVGLEAIHPEYAFDEDELNGEFKRLEMECETDRWRMNVKDEAKEKESDLKAPPTIGQRDEVTESPQSEAVPA